MGEYEQEIEAAASILSRATRATAFCGAGMSAESSIATFRDPGGLWDRIDPSEVGTVDGLTNVLINNTERLIPIFLELLDSFERADLNPGHRAIANLEKMGVLRTVITQNIDNLHQEAGSTDVIEMHGNLFRLKCLACDVKKTLDRKPFIRELKSKLGSLGDYSLGSLITLAPLCEACGSFMRPDVVMFGEAVQGLQRAFAVAAESDVMLVLGTSGTVYPAAYLPSEAKNTGASIIVVNPTEDSFKGLTDVYVPMKTGEALPAIVEKIKERAS